MSTLRNIDKSQKDSRRFENKGKLLGAFQLRSSLLLAFGLSFFASNVMAHPGHDQSILNADHQANHLLASSPFSSLSLWSVLNGFLHPWTGVDHLLSMLAVGLWAALLSSQGHNSRRALWLLPLCFMLMMAFGAALGVSVSESISIQESVLSSLSELGIAFGLVVFGGLICFRSYLSMPLAILCVGVFAVFHGWAHAVDLLVNSTLIIAGENAQQFVGSGLQLQYGYGAGMLMGTLSLHLLGLLAGAYLLKHSTSLKTHQKTGGPVSSYSANMSTNWLLYFGQITAAFGLVLLCMRIW